MNLVAVFVEINNSILAGAHPNIALLDARKALQMFRKVEVQVLGVVENMSTHICSECGHEEAIFGSGGGQRMAESYDIPLLGRLPLAIEIREGLDAGQPIVAAQPDSAIAEAYMAFARRTAGTLALEPRNLKVDMPQILVQNT